MTEQESLAAMAEPEVSGGHGGSGVSGGHGGSGVSEAAAPAPEPRPASTAKALLPPKKNFLGESRGSIGHWGRSRGVGSGGCCRGAGSGVCWRGAGSVVRWRGAGSWVHWRGAGSRTGTGGFGRGAGSNSYPHMPPVIPGTHVHPSVGLTSPQTLAWVSRERWRACVGREWRPRYPRG